jgi:asparagine synthase (glutamine-hydrolysing)
MCGIAGFVFFDEAQRVDDATLRNFSACLRYRGPDEEGYEISTTGQYQIAFAHKRLSIIDLSVTGRQPMKSVSGNSIIVFNGEIYNFQVVKAKLEAVGRKFRGTSDTEVILEAYEEWGIDKTLKEIEGMFAFCLFDYTAQKAFIARDRFGQKPLYYRVFGHNIAFSSDVRSFEYYFNDLTLDEYALQYYFQELSTPIHNSIWNEVKKLLPGHVATFSKQGYSVKKYWDFDYTQKIDISIEEAIAESDKILNQSVARQLIADVPVGTFLSGGVDSSLITALAARNYGKKLSTFSVGFKYESYNELPFANVVAEQYGTDHHQLIIEPNVIDIAEGLINEYGEPFADSSMIPSYYLCKFAAKHIKVILGGDGGDELFGGYRTYNQGKRMDEWYAKTYLRPILSIGSKLNLHPKFAYLHGVAKNDVSTIASALYRNMGFSNGDMKTLFGKGFTYAMKKEYEKAIEDAQQVAPGIFDQLLYGSNKTRLVNDYIPKVDRASMYASLEVRSPFLDKDLVEFTSKLTYKQLLHNDTNKYLTKKVAEKYVPHHILYREKMGFGIPVGQWFKNELKQQLYDVVLGQKQTLVDINYGFVEQVIKEHMDNKANHSDKLWALYVFHVWAELRKK